MTLRNVPASLDVAMLAALLARCGEARLLMPGGDAIGLRGIDFHVAGLRAMGASGETVIDGLDHLDRGYDRITEKLVACGAVVTRA